VTLDDLTALEPKLLRRARLIAFATAVIVPPRVLDQLGFGAYNFHPASPHFPGWAPAHFAVYQQATEFGATVHVMTERVDAGAIVEVDLFGIPAGVTVGDLERSAYAHLARLFWRLAKILATQTEPLREIPVRWSGRKTSRRDYSAMCNIPLDVSKEELHRRIRAFGVSHFETKPSVNLHDVQFQLATQRPPKLSQQSGGVLGRQSTAA
jgi:methionyl-tRNA formyltransferase